MSAISSSSISSSDVSSAREWWRFTIATLAAIAGLFVLMALTGRLLPEPFGSYNPMQPGIMRVEQVLQHATTGKPCILVLGDSRAAFSINSATLGSYSCPGGNYAFPGLGIPHAIKLAQWSAQKRRPEVVILSLSDNMILNGRGAARTLNLEPSTTWRDIFRPSYWLEFRPIRVISLNLQRYQKLFSLSWPLDGGWSWNERLGRWNATSFDREPLDQNVIRARIEESIARRYYENKAMPSNIETLLGEAIAGLRTAANGVVIIIPPQHPSFDLLAEQLAPGEQVKLREVASRVGRANGATVIDCLAPDRCGVDRTDFVDPVHIRPAGAEKLTIEIARRLQSELQNQGL